MHKNYALLFSSSGYSFANYFFQTLNLTLFCGKKYVPSIFRSSNASSSEISFSTVPPLPPPKKKF